MSYLKYLSLCLVVCFLFLVGLFWLIRQPALRTDELSIIDNNLLDPLGANIQVTEPDAGDAVGLPLIIKGYARVFENQFSYRILNHDETLIFEGTAMSEAEDSGQFGSFNIEANYAEPLGDNGFVEVFEYSAKDGSEINKVRIPVVFSSVQSELVKVFFLKESADAMLDCSLVYPVERRIPFTSTPGKAALGELLSGVSAVDFALGYRTSIPYGVFVRSLNIKNGVATVRFNDALQANVAGSCLVTSIRSQIENTLKQFPSVNEVVIEVDGVPADQVLQP